MASTPNRVCSLSAMRKTWPPSTKLALKQWEMKLHAEKWPQCNEKRSFIREGGLSAMRKEPQAQAKQSRLPSPSPPPPKKQQQQQHMYNMHTTGQLKGSVEGRCMYLFHCDFSSCSESTEIRHTGFNCFTQHQNIKHLNATYQNVCCQTAHWFMVMVAMDTRLGGTYRAISDVTYFTSSDLFSVDFELIKMKPTAYERTCGGLQKGVSEFWNFTSNFFDEFFNVNCENFLQRVIPFKLDFPKLWWDSGIHYQQTTNIAHILWVWNHRRQNTVSHPRTWEIWILVQVAKPTFDGWRTRCWVKGLLATLNRLWKLSDCDSHAASMNSMDM